MNLRHSWIIASKDLRAIGKRRTVIYTIVLLPLFLSLLFPGVIGYAYSKAPDLKISDIAGLLDAFAFWYVIIAAILPSPIASYSIVGEKVEKSLEPLLATPVTDGEILMGKSMAAFVPTILASYGGAAIYCTLVDWITYGRIGYLYCPNWEMAVILFLPTPLTALLSKGSNVIASARVTDVRSPSQLGGILFTPFIGIYLAGEIGVITLDTGSLLLVSVAFAALVVVMFFLSTRTFQREEILTKWK